MSRNRLHALVALLVLPAARADDHGLTALCLDGYAQTHASIRTLHCRMTMQVGPTTSTNPYTGKTESSPGSSHHMVWDQSGETARCTAREDPAGVTVEYLWKDGKFKHLKTMTSQGGATPAGPGVGRMDGNGGLSGNITPWLPALLPRPDQLRAEVKAGTVTVADDRLAGRPTHKLTIDTGKERKELWFDPAKNYMICQARFYNDAKDTNSYFSDRVDSFSEHPTGIFFPAKVTSAHVYAGNQLSQAGVEYKDVKINGPIDPVRLQLKFPAGTQVTDKVAGTTYVAGNDEQPVGPVGTAAAPYRMNDAPLLPTNMERPWPTAVIIAACAGAVVLIAAAVVLVRRRSRSGPG